MRWHTCSAWIERMSADDVEASLSSKERSGAAGADAPAPERRRVRWPPASDAPASDDKARRTVAQSAVPPARAMREGAAERTDASPPRALQSLVVIVRITPPSSCRAPKEPWYPPTPCLLSLRDAPSLSAFCVVPALRIRAEAAATAAPSRSRARVVVVAVVVAVVSVPMLGKARAHARQQPTALNYRRAFLDTVMLFGAKPLPPLLGWT